uniref:Uncharacterized protein n=1 Tax=Romanomermis culicivorax TaxID=13658 RepID=A0A915J9H1_ROMCU
MNFGERQLFAKLQTQFPIQKHGSKSCTRDLENTGNSKNCKSKTYPLELQRYKANMAVDLNLLQLLAGSEINTLRNSTREIVCKILTNRSAENTKSLDVGLIFYLSLLTKPNVLRNRVLRSYECPAKMMFKAEHNYSSERYSLSLLTKNLIEMSRATKEEKISTPKSVIERNRFKSSSNQSS